MKKLSQSTRPSKVKERVTDLNLVEDLYRRLGPVLEAIGLNPEGIAYHANSVIKSEIFQIARRDEQDRYLHLIAFIAHQYFRLQDNLVDVLITSLQSYQNSALREHKDRCYARREQRNPALTALVSYLDEKLLSALATIRAIAEDHQLNDTEKVERIRTLLTTHGGERIVRRGKARHLETGAGKRVERGRLLSDFGSAVGSHPESHQPDHQGDELSGRNQLPMSPVY